MGALAVETKFCPQCYLPKPIVDFVRRSGDGLARTCARCRKRYSNWSTKTLTEKLVGMPPRVDAAPTGRVLWVPRSLNQKLGGIPASWSERGTCPPSCGLYEAGCYASYGKIGFHWKNVTRDGLPWEGFLEKVRGLEESQVWRHNVAGDLQGSGQQLDVERFTELVEANRGRRGFTFTHKLGPMAAVHFAMANENGFTINLSADTPAEADRLVDLAIGPVTTLLPHDAPDRGIKTPAGRRVTVCPAETVASLTCQECQLCAIPDRKAVIGFRSHGNFKKHIPELVQLRAKAVR